MLISDQPAGKRRVNEYALRMRVESTFQDSKSRGWNLEASSVKEEARLDRLLLALFWRCGGSVIWPLPACTMANVIVLIALIGATRVFFVSDASGSWIFCVERAIKLTLFTAYLFASLLLDGTFLCAFKMCQGERGQPTENAFAESFFKTVKWEEVYVHQYQTFEEAQASLQAFLEDVYNAKRLHSSLDYVPPDGFELKYSMC